MALGYPCHHAYNAMQLQPMYRNFQQVRLPISHAAFSHAAVLQHNLMPRRSEFRASAGAAAASGASSASQEISVPAGIRLATATIAALVAASQPAHADTAELFTRNCAGMSLEMRSERENAQARPPAGATLSTSDMRKNGVLEPQALYDLIYGGRGKMPGYGEDCAPKGKCTFAKRLQDDDIRQLADYTLQQAEAGWQ